jgi:hypothetical protein
MDIMFKCNTCGQSMVIDGVGAGTTIDCPNCGRPTYVPSKSTGIAVDPKSIAILPAQPSTPPTPQQAAPQATRTTVVITDIEIPFWQMVRLMIKLGVASIPAAIVLSVIFVVVSAILSSIGLGLMMQGLRP